MNTVLNECIQVFKEFTLLYVYSSLCFDRIVPLVCSQPELMLQTDGSTPWTGDKPVARPLFAQDNTNSEKNRRHATPRVGFEPMFQLFERMKTFHTLDQLVLHYVVYRIVCSLLSLLVAVHRNAKTCHIKFHQNLITYDVHKFHLCP
jgi:hypothetical protein